MLPKVPAHSQSANIEPDPALLDNVEDDLLDPNVRGGLDRCDEAAQRGAAVQDEAQFAGDVGVHLVADEEDAERALLAAEELLLVGGLVRVEVDGVVEGADVVVDLDAELDWEGQERRGGVAGGVALGVGGSGGGIVCHGC